MDVPTGPKFSSSSLTRWRAPARRAVLVAGACGGLLVAVPTADDERVARAQAFTAQALAPRVLNATLTAEWIAGTDRFWFRKQTAQGHEFVIVDAATGRENTAFDHASMAAELSRVSGKPLSAEVLPLQDIKINGSEKVDVQLGSDRYACALKPVACAAVTARATGPSEISSPRGGAAAFIRNHNLWLRESASGEEIPLTQDGMEGYAYGDVGLVALDRVQRRRAGMAKSPDGILWSPDGRYLVTMRADLRGVPLRAVVAEFVPGDSPFTVVNVDRYSVAADNIMPARTITVIDTRSRQATQAHVDAAQLQDFAPWYFSAGFVWWDRTNEHLYLVTGTRDGSRYGLMDIELKSGRTRTLIEESERYFYSLNPYDYARPNWT